MTLRDAPPTTVLASGTASPIRPLAGSNWEDDPDDEKEGQTTTKKERKVEKPRRYKVLLHNDDYTTMEFVVLVLVKFFRKDETEATHIMLSVHHSGSGVAGVFPKDVAESKVEQVHTYAKQNGMPLKLTAEPE